MAEIKSKIVPASQGVAASMHTPQSAVSTRGTPIVDTSTSSDSTMGDVQGVGLTQFNQLNQRVRVGKAQTLQQQQSVVNLTADPMILAEAGL